VLDEGVSASGLSLDAPCVAAHFGSTDIVWHGTPIPYNVVGREICHNLSDHLKFEHVCSRVPPVSMWDYVYVCAAPKTQ